MCINVSFIIAIIVLSTALALIYTIYPNVKLDFALLHLYYINKSIYSRNNG